MVGFEKLNVWQKAVDYADELYVNSKRFPKEELFGITNQLRRASLSVALNIAEGAGRQSKREFSRFITIAYGSLCETLTILVLCKKRVYINERDYSVFYQKSQEIARMLSGLLEKQKAGSAGTSSRLSTLDSQP